MDEMSLTDWYDGTQKPVRVGVYGASYKPHYYGIMHTYKYWDGSRWGFAYSTVDDAYANRFAATNDAYQDWEWRGARHG